MPILRRLAANAQPDGYLFAAPKRANGLRGAQWDNAMRRLLEKVGIYEPGLGLHACRRAFATAFLHAGIKEEVAAKIMGHTINSMSYGTYVRKLDLVPALKAMRRALKFPRPPVYP